MPCWAGSFDFFENGVFKTIYSFHMPLFMLISGYLFYTSFEKRTLAELVSHQVHKLSRPIIMGGLILFCLSYVPGQIIKHHYISVLFNGQWLGYLSGLWFLWSVLSASLAVGIACKITRRPFLNGILLALGILFVAAFPNAELNIYMYPYFVIGFLYAKYQNKEWLHAIRKLKYICIPAFPVMMLSYRKEHYIYTSGLTGEEGLVAHMPINLFRWAVGLV